MEKVAVTFFQINQIKKKKFSFVYLEIFRSLVFGPNGLWDLKAKS